MPSPQTGRPPRGRWVHRTNRSEIPSTDESQ